MVTKKQCTICGDGTRRQPQNPDLDTDYGHCESCLNDSKIFVKEVYPVTDDIICYMYHEKLTYDGALTTDDSHTKVVQVENKGSIQTNFNLHGSTKKYVEWIRNKYASAAATA